MADNNTEKQRVQELTDKLEQGLQDLFNSDSYRNYLSTMSKFHNYSFTKFVNDNRVKVEGRKMGLFYDSRYRMKDDEGVEEVLCLFY